MNPAKHVQAIKKEKWEGEEEEILEERPEQ